jgi:hypothetical protein
MIPRDPRGCPRRSGRSRQHNGRSRFTCFAKKLVQVPKEIDEKAEEWKRSGSGTGTTSASRKSGPGGVHPGAATRTGRRWPTQSTGPMVKLRRAVETRTRPPTY